MPQRLFAQFPARIIREKILKNKEFLSGIREFESAKFKRAFIQITPKRNRYQTAGAWQCTWKTNSSGLRQLQS